MSRKRAVHPSPLERRDFRLADGRQTSVKLEPAFWAALERLAAARGIGVPRLLRELRAGRSPEEENLTSVLRVHALLHAPREEPARGPVPTVPAPPRAADPATVVRGRQTATTIAAINTGRKRPTGA